MGYKDLEKERKWRQNYCLKNKSKFQARRKARASDPVIGAKLRAEALARYHEQKSDPGFMKKRRARFKRWYALKGKERSRNSYSTHRVRLAERRYGLPHGAYNEMFLAQQGRCGICQERLSPQSKREILCIDHHHETGRVRGLLCGPCNSLLGFSRERPEILVAAHRYLMGTK